MKLRNKKTGEIRNVNHAHILVHFNDGETISVNTLAKLTDEWEDYEEPHYTYWIDTREERIVQADLPITDNCFEYIRKLGLGFATREEAEQAVKKLKAWKRLKEAGAEFYGWRRNQTGTYELYMRWSDRPPRSYEVANDLDLLFGGEE